MPAAKRDPRAWRNCSRPRKSEADARSLALTSRPIAVPSSYSMTRSTSAPSLVRQWPRETGSFSRDACLRTSPTTNVSSRWPKSVRAAGSRPASLSGSSRSSLAASLSRREGAEPHKRDRVKVANVRASRSRIRCSVTPTSPGESRTEDGHNDVSAMDATGVSVIAFRGYVGRLCFREVGADWSDVVDEGAAAGLTSLTLGERNPRG